LTSSSKKKKKRNKSSGAKETTKQPRREGERGGVGFEKEPVLTKGSERKRKKPEADKLKKGSGLQGGSRNGKGGNENLNR